MSRSGFMSALLIACAFGCNSIQAQEASNSARPIVVKEVLKTLTNDAGQSIRLPRGRLQLVVSTYDIPPGAKLPMHKHPYQRYAYVLEGALTVDQVGRGPRVYHAGEFVTESVNRWHFGENAGKEDVRLVVIDQLPPGKTSTVLNLHKH